MKVKEVMTKEIKSFSPDMSAKAALDMLIKMRMSGLPVIDESDKLVGIFTEKEILKSILPSYVHDVGKFEYLENPKGVKTKIANLEKARVKDIMRRDVITISEEATLSEAARIILTQKIRRMPVMNKEGKVIGIVATEDILKGLLGLLKNNE
jgi:CBS domain-containing protein